MTVPWMAPSDRSNGCSIYPPQALEAIAIGGILRRDGGRPTSQYRLPSYRGWWGERLSPVAKASDLAVTVQTTPTKTNDQ